MGAEADGRWRQRTGGTARAPVSPFSCSPSHGDASVAWGTGGNKNSFDWPRVEIQVGGVLIRRYYWPPCCEWLGFLGWGFMSTWGKEGALGVKYSLKEGQVSFQLVTHAAFWAARKVFIQWEGQKTSSGTKRFPPNPSPHGWKPLVDVLLIQTILVARSLKHSL